MSRGLRGLALPGLDLMEAINSDDITRLNCHEDNEATIAIIKSGKNPTMKHMNRTHGVQVRSLYDEFNNPRRNIQYIESAAQRADILTKCFRDIPTWKHVCRLIGLIDSSQILPPSQGMTET